MYKVRFHVEMRLVDILYMCIYVLLVTTCKRMILKEIVFRHGNCFT